MSKAIRGNVDPAELLAAGFSSTYVYILVSYGPLLTLAEAAYLLRYPSENALRTALCQRPDSVPVKPIKRGGATLFRAEDLARVIDGEMDVIAEPGLPNAEQVSTVWRGF